MALKAALTRKAESFISGSRDSQTWVNTAPVRKTSKGTNSWETTERKSL